MTRCLPTTYIACVATLVALLGCGIAVLVPPGEGPGEMPTLRRAWAYREDPAALFSGHDPEPLVPWMIGVLDRWLPLPGSAATADAVRLPYEHVVEIHGSADAPERWGVALPPFPYPRLGRFLGIAAALFVCIICLRTAHRVSGNRHAALLATGAVCLLPGMAVACVLPSPITGVVLFSVCAWSAVARPRVGLVAPAVAGVFSGLACLCALEGWITVFGACVLALQRKRLHGRPGVALGLAAVPGVLAGSWMLVRHLGAGPPPGGRAIPKDVHEVLFDLGMAWRGWSGSLETGRLHAGEPWMVFSSCLFAGVVVIALVALARRGVASRAWATILVGGLVLATGLLAWRGARGTAPDGRILHVLALPVVIVAGQGVVRVFRPHGLRVLAGAALCAAVGGPLFVHGALLPRFHLPDTVMDVEGGLLDADLGTTRERARLLKGKVQPYRFLKRHHPDRRMVVGPGGSEPTIEIALPEVEAGTAYLLSARIAPPIPGFGVTRLTHVAFSMGGRPLTGLLSAHGRRGRWIHMALGGDVAGQPCTLEARGVGSLIGVSRVAVRRLPFRGQASLRRQGEQHVVEFPWTGDRPAGAWHVTLLSGTAPVGRRSLVRVADGRARARFEGPLPVGVSGVRVSAPPAVIADLKAVLALHPRSVRDGTIVPGEVVTGRGSSPGAFVARLGPEVRGRAVFELGARRVPEGPVTLVFLDPRGRKIPRAAFVGPEGRPLAGERFNDGAGPERALPLDVVFDGTETVLVDRIIALRAPAWDLTLEGR